MNTFSIDTAISDAWKGIKTNPQYVLFFWIASLIPVLIPMMFTFYVSDDSLVSSLISIISNILGFIFAIGLIRLSLNITEGKKLTFSNLYQDYRLILKYFITNILFVFALLAVAIPLLVIIGIVYFSARDYMVFLIIPGIMTFVAFWYLMIRWALWSYFLVDKNQGAIESLKSSWLITKGNVLRFVLLYLVQGVIILLGFVALVIGLLVAIPVTGLMTIFVYKQLIGKQPQDVVVNPGEPAIA